MSEAQPAVAAAPDAVQLPLCITSKDLYIPTSQNFHFKKDNLGQKRPTINLVLMTPTLEGILSALQDTKQAQYIIDLVSADIYKGARSQVGDEQKPVNKQEELDTSKLTIEAIANMPKAERTGGGISKEVWEEFGKDFLAVMPGITGNTVEHVGNAAKHLIAKFQYVKNQKKVISFLKERLNLWYSNTPNAEEFAECFDFLDEKAATLLQADEASLLSNLGM
jgi:predicted Zn-dependent protease